MTDRDARDKQAMCAGKYAYETKGDAVSVLNRIRKQHRVKGKVIVYQCQFCNHYHIGRTQS